MFNKLDVHLRILLVDAYPRLAYLFDAFSFVDPPKDASRLLTHLRKVGPSFHPANHTLLMQYGRVEDVNVYACHPCIRSAFRSVVLREHCPAVGSSP